MTRLAIIGSGIAGRSLLYSLAKDRKPLEKITLFSSDDIAFPCTLSSTAVAAPRGISRGHSALGDLLVDGLAALAAHVAADGPAGVAPITHYNAATEDLERFAQRFPGGEAKDRFFRRSVYTAAEPAFLFDTRTYEDWLRAEARAVFADRLVELHEFVTEVRETETGVILRTATGSEASFDRVVVAGGSYNRFWRGLAPETVLSTSKPAQGSYLEFGDVPWELPSFSLTVDGDNVVWNRPLRRLFVGSTTDEVGHLVPPRGELREIHRRLADLLSLPLPAFDAGVVRVGLREKAKRRAPYLVTRGRLVFFGGLYKNAFTVALTMSRSLSRQLP